MKRAIFNELSKLSESQKGYVGALNYRYLNLCIKAEEASLLPVQVVVENEVRNLEDVAYAGKKEGDDYSEEQLLWNMTSCMISCRNMWLR